MTEFQQNQTSLERIWEDFCAQLAEAGSVLLRESSPRTPLDQAEGVRYLSRLTRTALNMHVDSADPDFPRLFKLADDKIKIGADNPDNIYEQAVIGGDRTYRIRGRVNGVPYLSFGTKANRYATNGTMISTGEVELSNLVVTEDGDFEIIVSRQPSPGNWLPMADDSTLLIVRQTFHDKKTQKPAEIAIERINGGPAKPALLTPEVIAKQLTAAASFVRGTANTFADWSEWFKTRPNRIYETDQTIFQRAGGDPKIWYGHAYFELQPGEAWVLRVHPPKCRMWNFQLDNWWMESLDYVHHKIWLNGHQAHYEPDGSVVIVCSEEDPGFGNWVDLAGHLHGTALWRWIEAEDHPVPACEVIKLDQPRMMVE
ncbi:DUF1214 domain-containing protein [Acidocella sp. KAb 2-4]|uniref:DUF1214 domain-containing protein n=1 Tax=Acidocella sp. KAb 2-4 TaxID=2885158 RepID=UPI001D098EA9|nr:DUF1214 domain-containing protein [Acidocella sp. KAb 2-4]MCB5945198.1 DUF1214 domain-containing protein [Acidocella sp. KAb 2-4]